MLLEGSCQCGEVRFKVRSSTPQPYQHCYCSICRKTQGGGGSAVNLGADARTLEVEGRDNITIYHARVKDPEDARAHTSTAERHFCRHCGSGLWLFSPEWPELVHPFASAIDGELPVPQARTHIMLEFKPGWAPVPEGADDRRHERYPEESIAEWHERMGATDGG